MAVTVLASFALGVFVAVLVERGRVRLKCTAMHRQIEAMHAACKAVESPRQYPAKLL